VAAYVKDSETLRMFRSYLFLRIVPVLKDIGLWGPKIVQAFEEMGVLSFAASDIDGEMANDEAAADEFDARFKARLAEVTEPD